jgi:hypothetical protein
LYQTFVNKLLPVLLMYKERNLSKPVLTDYLRELHQRYTLLVMTASLFFKNSAYKSEVEYRFLQIHPANTPVKDVKFKARPYALVRYREFDWRGRAPRALRSIRIGPAGEGLLTGRFAQDCLRAFHPAAETIEIDKSPIPYRPR